MSGPISENWDRPPHFDWLDLPPYLRPVTLGSLNQRLLRIEQLLPAMPDYPGDDEE